MRTLRLAKCDLGSAPQRRALVVLLLVGITVIGCAFVSFAPREMGLIMGRRVVSSGASSGLHFDHMRDPHGGDYYECYFQTSSNLYGLALSFTER